MKAVILAAGESSRFKPISDKRHKALTTVLGKPLIKHTIDELNDVGVEEIIVVQSPEKQIEDTLGDSVDHYVVQEEPKGMGDALKQAKNLLTDKFLVLTPYRANASQFFKPLIEKAKEENTETVFLSSPTDNPEKYGILDIDNGKAVDIIEKPETEEAPSNQKVVGMYLLDVSFFDYLNKVENWEYQYEDALSLQLEDNPASVLKVKEKTNSIKYPWDLFSVAKELLKANERYISDEADIDPSAEVKGNVIIEKNAKIYENAVINGPAYIGKDTVVGNNALVREHTCLEKGSEVGANTEIKNSIMQPDSSIHSGFIGDSVVGRNTKIGAGTITANRLFRKDDGRPEIKVDLLDKDYSKNSGRTFLGAFIGEEVDIGVNVSLMPGVQVGSNAKIGPGTIVSENVDIEETVYVEQEVKRR